jgi:adenylate kinase
MKIVLMGPQGSGKSVQAERLSAHYDIPHLAIGDVLRAEVAKKTAMGKRIEKAIDAGKLVSNSFTNKIVEKRLEENDAADGWILDGYPRDLPQAEFLDGITDLDAVIVIDIPEKLTIERIASRRICPKCGAVYGITMKPKKAGVCDKCGTKLVHRDDDKPDAIKKRLEIYHEETEPLTEYYKPRNLVHVVDGAKGVDAVFKEITQFLG